MLPPETQRLWNALQNEPLLRGAVLVGGTALALRIGHRRSDDLDFMFRAMRLPRSAIELCMRMLSQSGWRVERNDHPASLEEFEIAGMDLLDYQQDYLLDGATKVSFFTADDQNASLLSLPERADGPRVAELPEIFALKALVSASRSKVRDWFDLFILLRDHGFTWRDFVAAFAKSGMLSGLDIAFSRLCAEGPGSDDEGITPNVQPAPSVAEMKQYFRELRDTYEKARAAEARERLD